jgi:2-iminobutanoate/2-iminopropanoate deaminase
LRPEPIRSDKMPAALGPYSHAVRLGDLLFVSGQAGIDPVSEAPPTGSFEDEARQAFSNLRAVLEAAGSGMEMVAKVTAFLADAGLFPAMNALFAESFGVNPPARSTPIVALPRGLRISIEAIAGFR